MHLAAGVGSEPLLRAPLPSSEFAFESAPLLSVPEYRELVEGEVARCHSSGGVRAAGLPMQARLWVLRCCGELIHLPPHLSGRQLTC